MSVPATEVGAWSAAEREDFFAAIARHRRASWQVVALCAACTLAVGLVVALLMSPLLYALVVLLLDLVNFVRPTPNLVAIVMQALAPVLDDASTVAPLRLAWLTVCAAAPGLLLMALVGLALKRTLRDSALFDGGDLDARAPDPTVLAEQRFANTVEEMAIAAGLPPPRVLVVESEAGNAAIFGRDDGHATILVGAGLLATLERAQMQGVAAHLVGTMANGDLAIGLRVAVLMSLFGLVGRLAEAMLTARAWLPLLELLRLAVWPNRAQASALALRLCAPFASESAAAPATGRSSDTLGWRDWLRMPLAGPLSMTGFFGGIVGTFALAPLVALAWRRRKYMADASAVKLTRDPEAVAAGIAALGAAAGSRTLAPWADHCCVVAPGSRGGLLGGGMVPMFPAIERRLRALTAMGAAARPADRPHPPQAWLIGIPLFAVVGVLMAVVVVLLCWVSVALSMLFTWLPLALLSSLLRWMAS